MNIFKGLGDSALSRITSLRKSAQQYQELSREDKGVYGGPGSEFSWDEESLVNAIASDDTEALKMLLETSSYSLSDIEDAMAFASIDDKQDMLHLLDKYRNSKQGTKGDIMKFSKGLSDQALNRVAGLRKEATTEVVEKVSQEDNYWADVKSYAEDIKERFQKGEIDDMYDDMYDAIHETVDGSSWIIYYGKNLDVLNNSRHQDAIDEQGMEIDASQRWRHILTQVAYWAMVGDVEDELTDLGWDGNSFGEPEEEETVDEPTEEDLEGLR